MKVISLNNEMKIRTTETNRWSHRPLNKLRGETRTLQVDKKSNEERFMVEVVEIRITR